MLDRNSLDIIDTVVDEQLDRKCDELSNGPMLDLGQLENDKLSSLAPDAEHEQNDAVEQDDADSALDLSSLLLSSTYTDTAEDAAEHEKTDAQALYHDTVLLMKTGKTDLSTGVKLLLQAAQGGYALAWLHLGQIYSNKK